MFLTTFSFRFNNSNEKNNKKKINLVSNFYLTYM